MINSGTGNNVENDDFLQVLLALKESTMKATHVAEVCTVYSILESEYVCKSITTGESFNAISLKDMEIAVNDVVVILFTDYDFRNNLKRLNSNKELQYETPKVLHTTNIGIIIGII